MRLQAEIARFGPDIAVVHVSGGMTAGKTDALISRYGDRASHCKKNHRS
jgi:hypothetical protein